MQPISTYCTRLELFFPQNSFWVKHRVAIIGTLSLMTITSIALICIAAGVHIPFLSDHISQQIATISFCPIIPCVIVGGYFVLKPIFLARKVNNILEEIQNIFLQLTDGSKKNNANLITKIHQLLNTLFNLTLKKPPKLLLSINDEFAKIAKLKSNEQIAWFNESIPYYLNLYKEEITQFDAEIIEEWKNYDFYNLGKEIKEIRNYLDQCLSIIKSSQQRYLLTKHEENIKKLQLYLQNQKINVNRFKTLVSKCASSIKNYLIFKAISKTTLSTEM